VPDIDGDDRLYFRQLLAGRDFAQGDHLAAQMVNFVYLVGDRETGEAVAVDPAYAPQEIVELLAEDGMRLTGALATHYHPDHVGGDLLGHPIAGIAELLEHVDVPVHVQRDEAALVRRVTGVGLDAMAQMEPGGEVRVGALTVTCLHTPGHTPGSQCFLVDGNLLAGDTLFLQGCGRTDLPGGDPELLYESLFGTLARIPDETVLYPGHRYAPRGSATMGETRRSNQVLAPRSPEDWLALFGA
jgi:glyoxylase-like metal-dependent hydrolase (beta-lactamase superfamily II)